MVYEPPETSLRSRSIGPVALGMTEAEVASLGYPMRLDETRGADRRYVVSVAAGRDIGVTFHDGRVQPLTTSSSDFHAYRGGRVGATLDELRAYYPEGRVERGGGPYLSFVVAPGHAFMFDAREETGTCTRWDGAPCPEFGRHRAIRYSVTENSR